MRAVAREVALEKNELGHAEWFGGKRSGALQEIRHFAAPAPLPAGERDVRMKGAALGLEGDLLAGTLDLRGER
jgi:hypothetical protein